MIGTVGLGRAATARAGASDSSLAYPTKITTQMSKRGWTPALVEQTMRNPAQTYPVWDYTSGTKQAATAYARADGSYVVVNDSTHDVVQVSDRGDPDWKPVWNDPKFRRSN